MPRMRGGWGGLLPLQNAVTTAPRTRRATVTTQFKERSGRGSGESTEDSELGRGDGQRRGAGGLGLGCAGG